MQSDHPLGQRSHLLLDVADLSLQPLDGAVKLRNLHLGVLQVISVSSRRDLELLVLKIGVALAQYLLPATCYRPGGNESGQPTWR